ncbi:MAG TPA: dihydrodipicolinate synthase family protein [Acidimicrobiia bacterium]|nr:dihydrodipicolinate synthase family protein [Acidimicrobiia bacterium]
MAAAVFTGVGVALVTLFDDRGELDAPATADLAARLVDLGMRAVVVAGTTGEAAALEAGERIALLEAVRRRVPLSVPVIAGTGAPSARQAAALTRDAVERGADAVLTLSPPGVADPRAYFDAVAKAAGGAPVLAYHYPKAAPPGIAVRFIGDLPVAGIKDSSGDAERLLHELDRYEGAIYTGSSALLSFAGPLGCAGAILSLANAEPERCMRAFTGDVVAQGALLQSHLAAHESFPRGLKEMVAARFGTSTVCRVA